MNKKVLIGIGVVAAFVLAVAVYIGVNHSTEDETTVRIGYLPLTANLPLFVALEKGFFKEAGLKVETKKFESSNQMVDALVTGRIDVETAASSSVIVTVGQKLAGKIHIFMLNAFTPDDFLSSILVKKGSAITSPRDLEGKKIGSFPGSTMRMYTEMVLDSLQVKPMEIIQLTPPTQLGALENGAVDAIVTLEPIGTLGEVKGIATRMLTAPVETYVLNPWVAGSNSFSDDFFKNHRKKTAKLKKAFYRAVDYIRTNPVDAKKTMTKYTPVTDERLASLLTIPNYWKLNEIQVSEFQKMADNLLSHDEIDTRVDVNDLIMQK
jgi:NitT/TauT family transport system substrate-binding protein